MLERIIVVENNENCPLSLSPIKSKVTHTHLSELKSLKRWRVKVKHGKRVHWGWIIGGQLRVLALAGRLLLALIV
jgi:hypothetical protein